MLITILTMRQKDLSCVYMQKSGRICVILKCIAWRTQLCSWTVKYKNIVTHSVSEYPTTIYYSDIVWAAVLEQTRPRVKTEIQSGRWAKHGQSRSLRYRAGRPEPRLLCETFIRQSVITGRRHSTRPGILSVF